MKTIRKKVLEIAESYVCKDRDQSYGGPEDSFSVIAMFWDVFLRNRKEGKLEAYEVAIMMDLLKTARLMASTGSHADSWVDKAGYSACGAESSKADFSFHSDYESHPTYVHAYEKQPEMSQVAFEPDCFVTLVAPEKVSVEAEATPEQLAWALKNNRSLAQERQALSQERT